MIDRRELSAEASALYRKGDYAGALDLVERHADVLADDVERGWFLMCLRARVDDRLGALAAFADVVERGGWFDEALLSGERDLDPIRDDPVFVRLAKTSATLAEAAQASARPGIVVEQPPGVAPANGWKLLVALHGNSSDPDFERSAWSTAVADGYLVALPRSSQIGSRPGRFGWYDLQLGLQELSAHVERLRRERAVNLSGAVLAGFSRGAFLAALAAFDGRVEARRLLLVSPGLRDRERLERNAVRAAARDVRVYVVLGLRDEGRVGDARAFVQILRDAGVDCHLDEHEALAHDIPEPFAPTLARALDYLA
jgi:predicted esterase